MKKTNSKIVTIPTQVSHGMSYPASDAPGFRLCYRERAEPPSTSYKICSCPPCASSGVKGQRKYSPPREADKP